MGILMRFHSILRYAQTNSSGGWPVEFDSGQFGNANSGNSGRLTDSGNSGGCRFGPLLALSGASTGPVRSFYWPCRELAKALSEGAVCSWAEKIQMLNKFMQNAPEPTFWTLPRIMLGRSRPDRLPDPENLYLGIRGRPESQKTESNSRGQRRVLFFLNVTRRRKTGPRAAEAARGPVFRPRATFWVETEKTCPHGDAYLCSRTGDPEDRLEPQEGCPLRAQF